MIKDDSRIRFTLRLPDLLFSQLKEDSQKLGVPINALILQVLWKWEDAQNYKEEKQ